MKDIVLGPWLLLLFVMSSFPLPPIAKEERKEEEIERKIFSRKMLKENVLKVRRSWLNEYRRIREILLRDLDIESILLENVDYMAILISTVYFSWKFDHVYEQFLLKTFTKFLSTDALCNRRSHAFFSLHSQSMRLSWFFYVGPHILIKPPWRSTSFTY